MTIHTWGLFETALSLDGVADPLRDVTVRGEFVAPSGRRHYAPGFWDGGAMWKVRFAPDEPGAWRYTVRAEGAAPREEGGRFECVLYHGDNPLYAHGHLRVSEDRRRLVHADGTPFFFLGDTVWNGAMRAASLVDWQGYVTTRREQGFNAAMVVTTTWKGLPDGGPDGPSHAGAPDRVESVNPHFFQRMDAHLEPLVQAGIAAAPVLLWAAGSVTDADGQRNLNPGAGLPEEDAILLARHQVARWHAHPVLFILNGDGRYTGEHAARWHRIGAAVFADNGDRVPVALHCGGIQWLGPDFGDQPWVDVLGYQSGHRGNDAAWGWLAEEGPASGWQETPKAIVNLEPCYEAHNRMEQARATAAAHGPAAVVYDPFTPLDVRRAMYWSLLVAPTAGVTYGGHGVWGWDPGGEPPIAHALTGDTPPWHEALRLPAAEQLRHLRAAFESIPWWTLRPDQSLVRAQSGAVLDTIKAARDEAGSLAVAYLPSGGTLSLNASRLAPALDVTWVDPRTGTRHAAGTLPISRGEVDLAAPSDGDWLLILHTA